VAVEPSTAAKTNTVVARAYGEMPTAMMIAIGRFVP
jgi:hypothetical protein